jgi:hypothetical protein
MRRFLTFMNSDEVPADFPCLMQVDAVELLHISG